MNGRQRTAAADLVRHIDRMLDDWAEMGPGPERNRSLWEPLHRKADALDHALTTSPRQRAVDWARRSTVLRVIATVLAIVAGLVALTMACYVIGGLLAYMVTCTGAPRPLVCETGTYWP